MPSQPISLELKYTPPFDWESLLGFFRAHRIPDVETVDDLGYERVAQTKLGMGWLRVTHVEKRNAIRMQLWHGGRDEAESISATIRRMFDLDADPATIRSAMSAEPHLSAIWSEHPGLRVARAWNSFESVIATVLGQLVSVSFGRLLIHELMQAAGARKVHPKTGKAIHLFPTARQLIKSNLSKVRTSDARRAAIRALAELEIEGALRNDKGTSLEELRKVLRSVPGVGVWTAEYVAMRGFNDNDAFPKTDYGLKQELNRYPKIDLNRVRPWRAYAATALWKNFTDAKGMPYESVV